MLDPTNDALWMQEKGIQDRIQQHRIEQEIYWTQKAHQNWINLGDKNTKIFKWHLLSGKGKILFEKLWMRLGYGQRTNMLLCRFF